MNKALAAALVLLLALHVATFLERRRLRAELEATRVRVVPCESVADALTYVEMAITPSKHVETTPVAELQMRASVSPLLSVVVGKCLGDRDKGTRLAARFREAASTEDASAVLRDAQAQLRTAAGPQP